MGKAKRGKAGSGMVRVSTFLRSDQLDVLRARQADTGVVLAEQIRRAIDAALGLRPAARKGGSR